MKTKITKLNQPLMLLLLIGLITIGSGCKKEKNETEKPSLEGTWNLTSKVDNGKEIMAVWDEYWTDPFFCIQPSSKKIDCISKKIKLSSAKLVLLNDGTYVWTFSYDNVEYDYQKSRENCSCVYQPQYQNQNPYTGSWYTSPDGKTLMLKDKANPNALETYNIISFTNSSLHIKLIDGQDTYEYKMQR